MNRRVPKILIDPGHFAKYNLYAVLLPKKYYESEMAWALHKYLKLELEKYGFIVGVTRTDPNVDVDPVVRGKMAAGFDLLLSLHSNASTSESTNRAVMCCYPTRQGTLLDDVSDSIGRILGKVVKDVMALSGYQIYKVLAPWDRDGDGYLNDAYYAVLQGAFEVGTPAVIIEHSFHTNKRAANWLSIDSNLRKLAEAEAKALADYYGLVKPGDVNKDGNVDSLDASAVLKYDAGLTDLTEEQLEIADINKDGDVDSTDAAIILKHDAGLI